MSCLSQEGVPLRILLSPGLSKAEPVDAFMVFGIGSWVPFGQMEAQWIVAWALIAKQKVEVRVMLRLHSAPGNLVLAHQHEIDSNIMITMYERGMEYPSVNSCHAVILN